MTPNEGPLLRLVPFGSKGVDACAVALEHAGPFAGGGPLFNVAGGGGDASFGGGGGPYVPHQSNNSGRTSGIGGFGFVLIQVLSWSF